MTNVFVEKAHEYKTKLEKLKQERKYVIEAKVAAYRKSLEETPDTTITKYEKVISNLEELVALDIDDDMTDVASVTDAVKTDDIPVHENHVEEIARPGMSSVFIPRR